MPMSQQMRRARRMAVYGVAGALLIGPAAAQAASQGTARSASGVLTTSGTPAAPPLAAPQHRKSNVPCAKPSTTGAVADQGAAADKAAADGKAWTGVLERVLVRLHGNGSVNGTPSQHTRVSASGTKPVTVSVPVSGQVSKKRKAAGAGTPVVNHQAMVSLAAGGSTQQLVDTPFNKPLPVQVTVKYQLNGKPTSASQISGKKGTVRVAYTLDNVSAQRRSACFEGFDGEHQRITLQTSQPILAWLSFTVPSQAQTFSAPGSSLSPDSGGVFLGWTVPLFRPFGPEKRTFTLTMKTSQAVIPTATLWLMNVSPFTLTGKTPAASAQALGTAATAVAKSETAVRNTLAALQRAATTLQTTTSSSSGDTSTADTSGAGAGAGGGSSVVLDNLLASLSTELANLKTSLDKQSSEASGVSASARATAALATTINNLSAGIASHVDTLTAQQSVALQNAAQEVQQLEQLKTDLEALPDEVQNVPEVLKLAADLDIARDSAGKLNSAVSEAAALGQSVSSDVQATQTNITALVTRAEALQAASAALAAQAHRVVEQRVSAIVHHLDTFERHFAVFQRHFQALRAKIAGVTASIKARFEQARATARQDLANVLLKGEQDLQASAGQANAQLAQVEAQTQSDIAKANQQYALLLTLDQQADVWQLPGGRASDVTEQSGVYLYKIAGTSGKTKRQDTRQNKHEQRQNTRQNRRQQRQDTRQHRREQRQDNRQQRRQNRQANR